jgi:diaminopimelate epimerase
MNIEFSKFHGAGNDFVLIDNRERKYDLSEEQIALLCHRRFGIGADGMMLLESSLEYDFKMTYYNSDGCEGSMCGNGGRCITAFADYIGINKTHFLFQAVDGLHQSDIIDKNNASWEVNLQMQNVDIIERNGANFFLDTGSPHHVEFVDEVDQIDVFTKGKSIRNSDLYKPKNGTNVNFVSFDGDIVKLRTYERGVEDETLACGTGATAVAIATALQSEIPKSSYKLRALGGDLKVRFERNGEQFSNIWLEGPAVLVYSGIINL